MARDIVLRPDVGASDLRRLARRNKDANPARRPLAPAAICDGGTRSEAARLGTVTLPILLDRVVRFNAERQEGLRARCAPGPTPRLPDAERRALAAWIDRGPILAVRGVVRERLCDLGQGLWEEFRVSVSMQALSRELRATGLAPALVVTDPHDRGFAAAALLTLLEAPIGVALAPLADAGVPRAEAERAGDLLPVLLWRDLNRHARACGLPDSGTDGPIYAATDMLAWRDAVNWPWLLDAEGRSVGAARMAEDTAAEAGA
jgi:hypothetical protein